MTGLLKITLFAISVQATGQVLPPPVHPTPAPLGVVIAAPQGQPMPKRPKFMSTIQVAVHEPTFALQQRSQKLVIAEFKGIIGSIPSLAGSPMHIRTSGNEVVLSIFMEKDQRVGMQQAVATLINHLNGVVPARGRANFYRTNLSQPFSFLEVVLGEKPGTIRAISAQDIRLPDILAEIKQQFEERRARLEEKGEPPALMPLPGEKPQAPGKKPRYESLSYFVIGGCTNGLVTWSFGEDSDQAEDIPIGDLMQTLSLFLGMDKPKQIDGTYIFSGGRCSPVRRMRRLPEILRSRLFMRSFPHPSQVHFPLPPLGQ